MDGARSPSCPDPTPPPGPKLSDKGKRDEWSEGGVRCLLEMYESKWVLRNRAKLKGSDWEEIARLVSTRCSGMKALKTPTQCKNKIEAMKKRYRAETAGGGHDPGSGSTWQFYARMDDLLKGARSFPVNLKSNHDIDLQTPPKAEVEVEADGHLQDSNRDDESNTLPVDVNSNADKNGNKKVGNKGSDSNLSAPRSKEAVAEDGGGGPASSSKRRKGTGSEVAESIRLLAQSMLQIEEARLEIYKDTERIRAETEIKRGEMELKRTEIIANTQLQIAELFLRKMHKGSSKNQGD